MSKGGFPPNTLDGPEPTGDDAEPGPVFKSIDNTERVQLVRDQLQSAIANGVFKPGARLPAERELVEQFGVSRVSVREALRSLEAIGLIEMIRGRGSFVTSDLAEQQERNVRQWLAAHHHEVVELMKVRGAIEALGAEEAARRQDLPRLKALEAAHVRFVDAVEDGAALPQIVELDVLFHDSLAAASGSSLCIELTRQLNARLSEARRLTMMPAGRPRNSASEHDRIVRAVLSGNPVAAGSAVRKHVQWVQDAFIRFSEESPDTAAHE
jgi:GntR family transcriptional repressor for pyruvate dehydrogenase complex